MLVNIYKSSIEVYGNTMVKAGGSAHLFQTNELPDDINTQRTLPTVPVLVVVPNMRYGIIAIPYSVYLDADYKDKIKFSECFVFVDRLDFKQATTGKPKQAIPVFDKGSK